MHYALFSLKQQPEMTDEVLPQMAIQLIVVVVKMISVKCATSDGDLFVHLVDIFILFNFYFFFLLSTATLLLISVFKCGDMHSFSVMCACQKRREEERNKSDNKIYILAFVHLSLALKTFQF